MKPTLSERKSESERISVSSVWSDGYNGFARFVITVFIIYGSTHAKNLIMGSINFS